MLPHSASKVPRLTQKFERLTLQSLCQLRSTLTCHNNNHMSGATLGCRNHAAMSCTLFVLPLAAVCVVQRKLDRDQRLGLGPMHVNSLDIASIVLP